jgi:hypothetical protein
MFTMADLPLDSWSRLTRLRLRELYAYRGRPSLGRTAVPEEEAGAASNEAADLPRENEYVAGEDLGTTSPQAEGEVAKWRRRLRAMH